MKLKQILGAMTAFAMLGSMAVFPASAAEETTTEPVVLTETEGNDTIAVANELTPNATVQGNSATDTDKDYYKLVLEEDGKLSLNFAIQEAPSSSTATYWTIALYDANGATAKSFSIKGGQIIFNLMPLGLNAGTYYISVTPDDYYYSDQTYSLTAGFDAETEWESETNDTLPTADDMTVNTAMSGNAYMKSDIDYYKFTLTEDCTVDVTFSLPQAISDSSDVYWVVSLYTAEGTEELLQTINITGNAMNFAMQTAGLGAGTYYIKVEADNYDYTDAAYVLTANAATGQAFESEDNDSIANADTLALDTAFSASLQNKTDVDYFAVTLENDAALTLNFGIETPITDNSTVYWTVTVMKEDNTVLYTQDIYGNVTNTALKTLGLDAGTYYVQVQIDYYYNSAIYSLKASADTAAEWEGEGNDSIAAADTITAGTAMNGSLMNSADVDYYALALTEDAAVSMTFALDDPATDVTYRTYWIVNLLDAESTILTTYKINGNNLTYPIRAMGLDAGTYYIQVKSDTFSSNPYKLTVNADAETEWEGENNDSMTAAEELTLGTGMNGLLHTSSDIDYYKFAITEDSGITVNFDLAAIVSDSTSKDYWNVSICTEDGNIIASYEVLGNGTKFNVTTLGLAAGSYYIRVEESYYYTDTQYTLTVQTETDKWEAEFNDSISQANTLSANTPIIGRIHASDGQDYYKLTLDKSGKLTVQFQIEPNSSNSSEYWQLSLLDENSNVLETLAITGENGNVSLAEYEAAAGTYYVLVENDSYYYWTTPYTMTADFEENTYILGDVNEDGEVDAADAALLLVAAAKIGSGAESGLTETQELAANVNGDEGIDATDAAAILSYAAAVGAGDTEAKLEDYI